MVAAHALHRRGQAVAATAAQRCRRTARRSPGVVPTPPPTLGGHQHQQQQQQHMFTTATAAQPAPHQGSPAAAPSSSSSNLGMLQRVIEQPDAAGQPWVAEQQQRVSPASFTDAPLHWDPAAVFGSGVLLLILLALTFERILGLDRVVLAAVRRWKEQRQLEQQLEAAVARQRLEEGWSSSDEGQGGSGGQDGNAPRRP